jgi:hypothetical protein
VFVSAKIARRWVLSVAPSHRLPRLHPVFPVMKLQLAEDDPFEGCPSYDKPVPVLPDILGDLPEWEVKEILGVKFQYTSLWYMVQCKRYDASSRPNFVTSSSPTLVIAATHSNFICFLI